MFYKKLILVFCLLTVVFACKNNSAKKESKGMEGRKISTKQRHLELEGAYNVRDLGGYKTKDDKTVKWNSVYRSDDLNNLTEHDLSILSEIPMKSYIDFRDSAEIANAPDKYPKSLENKYTLSIDAGSLIDLKSASKEDVSQMLVKVNRSLVENSQDKYTEFFRILMDTTKQPLLFHCSAGKDRTGFGAALFLSALGVDRETILEDYLLSNHYLKDKYAKYIEQNPDLEPLMTVDKSYLNAAFEVIDTKYGGVENYLTNNLGVDINLMKQLYLE